MTEDEADKLVPTMFDEVKATTVKMVNGKRYISDEETLREMEFAEACEELVAAEREFAEWDAKPGNRDGRTRTPTRRICASGSTPLSGGIKPTRNCG